VRRPTTKRAAKRFSRAIENIPSILEQAEANLDQPPAPFATVAIQALTGVDQRLREMATELVKSTTLKGSELSAVVERAADALGKFRKYLQREIASLPQQTALGRDAYVFFLRKVALMPYSPEELLAMGRQNGTAQLHLKPTKEIANRMFRRLNIEDNIDKWIADERNILLRFLS